MSTTTRLLSICSMGILACGRDSITEPDLAGAQPAANSSAHAVRSAGGTCGTAISFVPPVPGQAPNVTVVQIALDCNLQHLGRTSGDLLQTIVSSTTDLSNTLTATTTYVAANGDELHASFAGVGLIDPTGPSVSFSGTETYTGGTGRFVGATGSSTLVGTANLITNIGEYRLSSGSISY